MARRARTHLGRTLTAASLAALLTACSGAAGDDGPTATPAETIVAGRGSTPVVQDDVVVPPAPTFADPDAPAAAPPSSPVEPLLPTSAQAAAWSPDELLAWAGQLDGLALPADGTWRSLSVGLQFSADGSGLLDGIETDLVLATPQPVDALVAQQAASPPPGTTVQDVVEGEEGGRRAVAVVLHTPGSSADSVEVVVAPEGGSLVHVQHLPRRDDARPELTEERVQALVARLTQDALPDGWRVRFARLTVVSTSTPAVMVAWSAADQDVAQAMATAQAALPHLTFGPSRVTDFRTTAEFTDAAAGTTGTIAVNEESDGTTRVELEARG